MKSTIQEQNRKGRSYVVARWPWFSKSSLKTFISDLMTGLDLVQNT